MNLRPADLRRLLYATNIGAVLTLDDCGGIFCLRQCGEGRRILAEAIREGRVTEGAVSGNPAVLTLRIPFALRVSLAFADAIEENGLTALARGK